MKRTDIHQGRCIKELFPVAFDQISVAVARMSVVSFLFIGIIFILTAGLSQAGDADKIQGLNSTIFPPASLKTIIVEDYYPYTFVNDKGIPDGFSVDIAGAAAGVMGLKLEISVGTWANAIKALRNGSIGMLPMMAASPERDKIFDFSVPHTIAYDAIFARKGAPWIRSPADLVDKTVIVLNKDAAHDYLLSSGMAARMKLIPVDSLPEAFQNLAAGKGDAALMPKLVGLIVVKKLNLTNLDPSPVVIDAYNRPFCFAVKQGDQFLLERLSQGLSIIKATGQYQEIYEKWFGSLEPPGLSRVTVIKYIAGIAAVSLLIGLGLIIWNVSLREQVALRTEKLETEIQERLKTEKILSESEEQYRNLFENAAEAIYVVQDGKLVFLNPMTATMTGYSGEELMARPFPEFIHPDDRDMVIDRHVRRIRGEELPSIYSFRIIHKDGNIRWVELNVVLINWKGKPATLNFLSNITERNRAEDALRESEERLRDIIFSIADWVWEVDENGVYTYSSKKGIDLFGKFHGDIIGKTPFDFMPPDEAKRVAAIFSQIAANKAPIKDLENWNIRKNGERICLLTNGVPILDEDGNLKGYRGVDKDVTEHKRAEEELRASRSRLRALAARLQQIREYERIMIAREIHDEMGGGLTGLKMDLSWLLRKMSDADPGEARVALMDKIHTSNALIDQMIGVVRRISTDLRPSVLDDLGLIAALEWQLSEFTSRTEISHEFAATIEYVDMEEDTAIAVFRIFQEALTNVMRHSRATKVAVVLREDERSLFGDENLVLEIRDNGRGITEEEILNPESLGLLGMKERVLAFGGEISIRCEPGGGTTVVLKIPKKQGEPS